ncbi:MAG: hypothetical protein HYV09_19810 [Deltaproteobacteria bacterium]|nr:hypothetical protein [Deltaproteobacteria bacterium]
MNTRTFRLFTVASALSLTACGGGNDLPETADPDAAIGADALKPADDDTGTAGTDTSKPVDDTGSGGAGDTGSAPTDTGSKTDAGGGTAGDKGVVNCGPTLKCTLPQICCIGFAGGATYKCEASCSGLSAAAKCDGPEDCTGTQRCCSGFPSGAQCKATCGSGEQDVCHVDGDCTGGKTCKECATPGGGPSVRFCVAGGKCPY